MAGASAGATELLSDGSTEADKSPVAPPLGRTVAPASDSCLKRQAQKPQQRAKRGCL